MKLFAFTLLLGNILTMSNMGGDLGGGLS